MQSLGAVEEGSGDVWIQDEPGCFAVTILNSLGHLKFSSVNVAVESRKYIKR